MGGLINFGSLKDGETFSVFVRGDVKINMKKRGAYAKNLDNGDVVAMVNWQEVERVQEKTVER